MSSTCTCIHIAWSLVLAYLAKKHAHSSVFYCYIIGEIYITKEPKNVTICDGEIGIMECGLNEDPIRETPTFYIRSYCTTRFK